MEKRLKIMNIEKLYQDILSGKRRASDVLDNEWIALYQYKEKTKR